MSPDRVDIQRMLERMAAADAPPPRPAFVAELESRVRRGADDDAVDSDGGDKHRLVPARRPLFVGGAAAAALVVLIAAVTAFGGADDDGDHERVATRPTAPPTTESASSPVVPAPTVTMAPTDSPGAPVSTSVPALTPTTSRSPATTATPTTHASSTKTMALTAERDLDGVHLSWTPYTGPNFSSYICLRAEGDNQPTYPADANTRPVWRETDQAEDYYLDRGAPPGGVSYLMVAVDSSGRELARSNVVSVRSLSGAYERSPLTS